MRAALRFALAFLIVLVTIPIVIPREPAQALGQVSVYMGGLNVPIALAFSSDGRIFFSERNTGNIRIIEGGTLLAPPFYTIPNTNAPPGTERGLLGLALAPGFPANPWVYAYQTYNDAANASINNRIVRIQASGNVGVSMQTLLRLPNLVATNHNGGVIGFGPDGKLYAVVGENANIALAQNPLSPMGKVLRMNPDGTAPSDNPFIGNASWNPLVYTYGHRNMFGLAFHPLAGRAYVTENGPGCNDEINLLVAGRNFAWGTSQTCGTPPSPPNNTNRDGPLPRQLPIHWWGPTICPTNAAIYTGPFFPQWQGDMFMGDCNFSRLHRLDLVGPNYDTVASDTIIWNAPSFIMDVEQGPDGAIWFTTPTTIYRYWDSGRPPGASFTATPNPTTPSTPITFDGSASTDPDGMIATYSWDFGDGQTATGRTTLHAYAALGSYVASLTVQDNETFANRTTRTILIQAGPAPPRASFTAIPNPASPAMVIRFNSTSSDPDGFIVSEAWDFGDGQLGSGPTVNHAYAAVGAYVAALVVTDNQTLTNRTTHTITIQNPPLPPTAAFVMNQSPALPNSPVTFDASASTDPDGTIVSYAWDFGDATSGSGMIATHSFASGQYAVTLTVVDNQSLSGNVSHDLLVDAPPRADIVYAPSVVYKGTAVAFDASGSSDGDGTILSYLWWFGDGAIATGRLVAHAYGSKGTYGVSLVVTDDFGLTGGTGVQLVLANRPASIVSSDPDLGPVFLSSGSSRTFTVTATDPDGDIINYRWEVDGMFVPEFSPSFDFRDAAQGNHTVKVSVSDIDGGPATESREWMVTVTPASAAFALAWWPVAILLAAILLVLVLAGWQRRRKDRARW